MSIHGNVKPVGGVVAKVRAAKKAGARKVFIPKENYQSILDEIEGIDVVPVMNLNEVFTDVFPQFSIEQTNNERFDEAIPASSIELNPPPTSV